MKLKPRSQEKGQALILVVLGMVALLGFTALAIDGSMVYADRRHAQNAADAASLAGGAVAGKYLEDNSIFYSSWNCSALNSVLKNAVENAAVARAGDNNITIDRDISDNNGAEYRCVNETQGNWSARYIEITTRITVDTNTSFIHFVYNGPVRNTVEAVTRIRPRSPLAFGSAVVALNKAGCSGNKYGVQFGGSSQNSIYGGGVYSNGCLGGNGSTFSLDITNGTLYGQFLEGSIVNNTNVNPPAQPVNQQIPDDMFQVPVPNCSGLPTRTQSSTSTRLSPGIYTSISVTNNQDVTLERGLYCLTSGSTALKMNGGKLTGNGVTFFITSSTGAVSMNGGEVDLRAISFYEQANPYPAVPNVLMYSLGSTSNADISIVGNNDSRYLGLIYCPYCSVYISGSSGTWPTFNTQIVANNVFISGNATLDIIYNNQDTYDYPTRLDLMK
jgi:hypothetical protein